MAIPRKELVDSQSPGFYHVTNRCVRRAYLCGSNSESGRNYDHRKDWLEKRIFQLSEIFAVDIYAYAVMSNHYHIVLYVDPHRPQQWTDDEVADRWLQAYPGKLDKPENAQKREAKKQAILNSPDKLKTYRKRLGNLSWFMGRLNEPLARMINREDLCTGCFWEGRYHSQILLDEAAVMSCMAYVDLNPVRATITEKLEESHHTSVKRRIDDLQTKPDSQSLKSTINALQRRVEDSQLTMPLKDYLVLVEWTGQCIIHPDKASIPTHITPILERLNLQQHHWLKHIEDFGRNFKKIVGPVALIRDKARQLKLRCLHGVSAAKQLYLHPG